MPARCSRLMTSRSRQITWMELKQPFQIPTQVSAKAAISVPSMEMKNIFLTTIATRPAITAAIGRTFQSF